VLLLVLVVVGEVPIMPRLAWKASAALAAIATRRAVANFIVPIEMLILSNNNNNNAPTKLHFGRDRDSGDMDGIETKRSKEARKNVMSDVLMLT